MLRLLKERTPAQRFAMAGDMFAATRALMAAALRQQGGRAGSVQWKLAVLDRTYGAEISAGHRRQLIARWSREP